MEHRYRICGGCHRIHEGTLPIVEASYSIIKTIGSSPFNRDSYRSTCLATDPENNHFNIYTYRDYFIDQEKITELEIKQRPYDTLIDEFEPGMTVAQLDAISTH